MHSVTFAGISFPLVPLLCLTALLLVAVLNRCLPGRVKGLTDALITRALIALITARIVFVGLHLNSYDHWLTVVDIRDRGFHALTFGLVFLAGVIHYGATHRRARHRLFLAIPLISLWVPGGYLGYQYLNPAPAVWPTMSFQTLDGEMASFGGTQHRLTVVNLWATWCPSCRTEMPVLERAQNAYPDVRFVMHNQGEIPETVRQFLESEDYQFENVWLDHNSRMGQWLGQTGIPVTLVFDQHGNLLTGHTGVVSTAVLSGLIETVR